MARTIAGFTLMEEMIVLALIAISLAIGLPAFGGTLKRMRTQTTLHLISADLAMARNAAIMRHEAIVVCPKAAGSGCGTPADWTNGWLVFRDEDGNRQPDAAANVLRSEDAPTGRRAVRIVSSRAFVRYQRDGRSANSNLTVHVCHDSRITGQVIVNNLGRVRTTYAAAEQACPGR